MIGQATTHMTSFRAGSSFSLPEVIRSLGKSPDAIFAAAGVDLSLYQHPENRIPAEDLGRLFSCAAQMTGRPDIGLLVAASFRPGGLGLVGELAAEGPDVETALKNLVRLLQYNTLAGYPVFSASEMTARIGFVLRNSDFEGSDFLLNVAIGIAFRFLQWLCRRNWRPEEIHFAQRAPSHPQLFEDFFGVPVRFSVTDDAVLFSAKWLKKRVVREERRQRFKRLEIARTPFSERVRREVAIRLGLGQIDARTLARALDISERQLFRRLSIEGTTCRQVVDDVKFSRARHLLQAGDAGMPDIAFALGYSEHSAFTRAFTKWSGLPPNEWRIQH